ncbi:BZ3500_MvSof-1268-A1-R1_Chr10-2g02868 [Microbotryum saponariae]|uniref:COP9 signalosome complex subunit 4 n=1 Tax=Microbotryum saponariae TaxID=289078 RepID=A0A2X0LR20_9BASI|nr:BZ3501_MvSof-1269-A2-R1_Chr10-2g02454 [Microbotryum saponariae]SDA01643.1 BZ3500_MvSof-1268-A1-R1_Chr10-2g02868 [Microbotryum saponariae]
MHCILGPPQTPACIQLLNEVVSASSSLPLDLIRFLDATLASDFPPIVARPTLSAYIETLCNIANRDVKKHAMGESLQKLQSRTTTYEEQITTLREHYATLLEEDEEWISAAQVLNGVVSDASDRPVEYKLKIYIRIVRLYLEEQDSTSAETYFNRASLISHSTDDLETQLQFKLCQARMLDFNRKFVEAASRYHEISYIVALEEADRLRFLRLFRYSTAAITCAILAPAGPRRSRILSALFRDERSSETPHQTVLAKMFLDQTFQPTEIAEFAASLSPHQLARLPPAAVTVMEDDTTVEMGKRGPETLLDRAVMEHNILAASKVYNNITFTGLGHLLGIRPSSGESMVRTMIQQGRLCASINQVLGLVNFIGDGKAGDGVMSNVAAAATASPAPEETEFLLDDMATKRWDLQIRGTLQLAEAIALRCEEMITGLVQ